MPKLTIDGKEIEVADGTSVFEAARQNNIEIPHFCYHPKLSIAGNCRMCLVDVEKMPKPQISCNTMAQEGMVVNTKTDKVKELQKLVLEFLLINHPIDCPVCDQAGECKLQEFYMDYTVTSSDFHEAKNKKPKKVDLGPYVKLDDERCILCTRCVRFCDEITKTGELCVTERGDRSTLTTFPGKQLDNKYSMNTVDICPVGALTSKPFRFQQRVWFLKSAPSICTGCATGCNTFIDYNDSKVWRYRTRENEAVNQCWTCDEGRLTYQQINEQRLIRPMVKKDKQLEFATEAEALQKIAEGLAKFKTEEIIFIGSAQESNENNAAFKKFGEHLGVSRFLFSFHEPENPYHDDFLIKADKNPNRAGVLHLGFEQFSELKSAKAVVILNGLAKGHWEQLKKSKPEFVLLLANHESKNLEFADVVLPASSFAEQEGSFTNFQKRVQKFTAALEPKGQMRPVWQWLNLIAQKIEKKVAFVSPEKILEENFGVKYADVAEAGKVLE